MAQFPMDPLDSALDGTTVAETDFERERRRTDVAEAASAAKTASVVSANGETTQDPFATLAANKTSVKAAIVAKNPATAPTDVMNQWPTAIASIPVGSAGFDNLTLGSLLNDPDNNYKIRSLGNYAFSDCYQLTALSLPVATSVGNYAFSDCASLTALSLPVATSVGNYAFSNCASLTALSLPVATSVGNYAFSNCASLTALNLSSLSVAEVTAGAGGWDVPSGCTVTCRDGTYVVP